jgi:peptide/nickel transport system permease protein
VGRFILRRALYALPTLALVSVLVFCLAQLAPGDVGRSILGPYAAPAQVRALDHQLGYDRPLMTRYFDWLGGFFSGHWGNSVVLKIPISHLVFTALGHSLLLAGFALVLLIPSGIALGVLAGLRRDTLIDRSVMTIGTSLAAIPDFVVGVLLMLVFGVGLRWLPVNATAATQGSYVSRLHNLILPACTLTIILLGYVARMARTGTIDTMASPFVRTAVLKGLPQRRVLGVHMLRNALIPTVTVVGNQIAYLVGGLVVTETLFNYHGFGSIMLQAAKNHDIPVLQTGALLLSVLYMVAILATDLTYAVLDPRVVASA